MSTPFDPDAAATPGSGLFGLTCSPEEALVHVLGVPFDATTSYRSGTRRGPEAVLAASHQIDLYDRQFGHPYQAGIVLHNDPRVRRWNKKARKLAKPIIKQGGHIQPEDQEAHSALDRIEILGNKVNRSVRRFTEQCLESGKIPAILGGDHSVPLGAMQACAKAYPGLGILHIDAHADLRIAFEGFAHSHASIMHNVLESAPGIASVVQIGLRDVGWKEARRIDSDDRIHTISDDQWGAARMESEAIPKLIEGAISSLPEQVYITFDIDGLDPSLCPNTGTPVPGGLYWNETMALLQAMAESGKRVVGFDLCEVNPGRSGPKGSGKGSSMGDSWDAVVGARLLYKLCGLAISSRSEPGPS